MRIVSVALRSVCMAGVLVLTSGPSIVEALEAARQRPTRLAQQTSPDQTPVERERGAAADRRAQDEPVYYPRAIVRIAQDYTVARHHVVRHVQTFFGNVTIEGQVEDDVIITVGSARVASTAVIRGSLVVLGGSATIDAGARVGRDLVVVGGTLSAPPEFSAFGEQVVVGSHWTGEWMRDLLPWITRGPLLGRLIVPDLDWIWGIVFIFFFLYMAVNLVLDRAVGASADLLVERPLSAFMSGLMVLLLAVPVLVILVATVIGVAVIPFVLCARVAATLVGKVAVARAMGRSILRRESEGRLAALIAFVMGFALLTLAYIVPVLGFVTWALTTVLGLGAAASTFRTYLRRERRAGTPPTPPVSAPPAVPSETFAASPAAASLGAELRAEEPFVAPPVALPVPPVPPPPAAIEAPPPPSRYSEGLAAYPRASFLDRLAAFVLDCLLVGIANAFLDVGNRDGEYFIMLFVYHLAFWAWRGTTLGGIIIGLKIVRTHGAEMRVVDAIVRGLSAVFSVVAMGIGCLWMLQDRERQMWHDKIAGTLVIKGPREVVLPQ
jgi:uncharacterized RDD family membrane protein YckC